MNIGISEILLVLLIALLVIKPEQMPEVAFALGRFGRRLRKVIAKFKNEMSGWVEPEDR